MSSFYILGFFPRNAPPSFIPHPRNVAASESSISTSLAQEDSAFNHSATNPYNYPMTQIPPERPTSTCTVYSTCRTNFLCLFLGDNAIHSSNTFGTLAPTVATTAATSTPSGSSVSGTAAPTGQGPNLRSRRN